MKITKAQYIELTMRFMVVNDLPMTVGMFAKMVDRGYVEYLKSA